MRNRIRSESGASAVEFALLLPVLMMILFGIIEFGIALYQQAVLTNASREGARAGIVQCSQNCPNPTTVITQYLTSAGLPGGWTPVVNCPAGTGSMCSVQISMPYKFMVLQGFASVGPQITLQANTVMRHE